MAAEGRGGALRPTPASIGSEALTGLPQCKESVTLAAGPPNAPRASESSGRFIDSMIRIHPTEARSDGAFIRIHPMEGSFRRAMGGH